MYPSLTNNIIQQNYDRLFPQQWSWELHREVPAFRAGTWKVLPMYRLFLVFFITNIVWNFFFTSVTYTILLIKKILMMLLATKKSEKCKCFFFPDFFKVKVKKIPQLNYFKCSRLMVRVKPWLEKSGERIWDAEYRKWIWATKSRTKFKKCNN